MAPHASQQPPIGPRPSTEFAAGSSYPLGFVRPQSQGQMDSAWPSSEGSASAGAWDLLAGSHGVVRQPIAAVPLPQGHAGEQGAWVPFS